MEGLALVLATLIGISLGLLGGGGSTLAVPILVYVAGMPAKPAIAASLLVVGATSFVGALRHRRARNLELRTALVFGTVSMTSAYVAGRLAVYVSDTFQLVVFALVMLAVSASMFRASEEEPHARDVRLGLVVLAAAGVGALTGLVGAGGGFLIVPALVLFAGLPIKRAVGTSLAVIAMNTAAGFAAYAGRVAIDWMFTTLFTLLAIAGVVVGSWAVHYVRPGSLRRAFAAFLAVVAVGIVVERIV